MTRIEVAEGIFYDVPVSTVSRPIETLFAHLPKSEQYWQRQTDFPEYFFDYDPHLPNNKVCRINATRTEYRGGKLRTLSVEDTIELSRLVQREATRMRNGVFIMNDGEKVYFPGTYYGALQWGMMFGVRGGYGQHREYQRYFCYSRELVIQQDALDGYYCHKIKKSGITQLIALFQMVECITNTSFTAAVMSKNHETAKKANYKYLLFAVKNLPAVIRPRIDQKGWRGSVQKLEIKTEDEDFNYECTYAAVPTTVDGLDGLPPIQRIHIDEPPKIDNIEEVYTKSKEQSRIQQTKIGIIEMSSYPPETDTKAFYWCKNFYQDGCEKRGEDGWPLNKMLPICIGIAEATNGTFDIYGKPNKVLALQMEQQRRSECVNPSDLQARKRQYFINAKEGWESGGGGSVYNNIALTEQEAVLEEEPRNYTEGNLEWTEGRFSKVRFVPLTHDEIMKGGKARWKLWGDLTGLEARTNLCFQMSRKTRYKMEGSRKVPVKLLQPPDDVFNSAGCDPVDYALLSEVGETKSKNAFVVKDILGNLLAVFHDRAEDPDDDIDAFIMGMIFFGARTLVEGNRKNAITTLEKQGMDFFLLIRHTNGQILPTGSRMDVKHVSSGKDLKSLYISLVMKKIKNRLDQFQSIDIIRQHKMFDAEKTQKFDLAVADGLSEVALDAVQTWVISKKSQDDDSEYLAQAMSAVMGVPMKKQPNELYYT